MIVVFVTTPEGEGKNIARIIVERKLAACSNIIEKIHSIFHWENKIEEEKEELIIFKTTKEKFEELKEEIKKLHPYSVPEIISLDISEGNKEYIDWLTSSLQ